LGNFNVANPDAWPTSIQRASGTGRYRIPLTMLKPSLHHVPATVPSIVAVMPVAVVEPTHLLACMPFCDGNAVADVTVEADEHWFSWMRVWLVVVTVDWLHHARVNSAAVTTGTRTWLTVIAVDVVTAALINVYEPDAVAMPVSLSSR
jgi:hypothetical protein